MLSLNRSNFHFMRLLFVLFLSAFGFDLASQSLKIGEWKGEISYEDYTVPFLFEVSPSGGEIPEITFINGSERRTVTNAEMTGDTLVIPMDPFDVTIKVRYTAMSMEGFYIKHYRDAKFPFNANFGQQRFTKNSVSPDVPIEEKWDMTFSPETSSMSKGVGIFKKYGNKVFGTVLTETSDYRYFEGIIDGDSMMLSSFDGAHAFMILGKKKGAKEWKGTMVFDNSYSEPWIAKYDPNASIKAPFEVVKVEKGVHKPYYDLLGAGSGRDVVDPSKYQGKVLIIQAFGTWCPNSHDQTKFLSSWYEKNKQRNVAILASSYEANYSQDYGLSRIKEYKLMNNISYDVVLGGRLSKVAAATPFPFIDRIKAFPTLVIVDKEGYARYVHSYFNGPATGTYYKDFIKQFNTIIDELEAE